MRPRLGSSTRLRVASVLVAAALVAGGCGTGPGEGAPTTTSAPQATTTVPATTTTAAGADATSLTIAPRLETRLNANFNPFDASSVLVQMGVTSFIYEPLLQYNELQVNQYYPWLAESWAFSTSGQTITFDLRPRVTWDNGSQFTAYDVAYTFNLLKDNPGMNRGGIPIVLAAATDPSTFTLTLSQPAYAYLYEIARVPIVQSGFSQGRNPARYIVSDPVGTGPYVLASRHDLTPRKLVLTARRNYWQEGEPPVQELVFPAYSSSSAVASAFKAGDLDWADQPVPSLLPALVGKQDAGVHVWAPPVNCVSLVVNLTRYPLDELAVREAVSATIDRNALSAKAENSYEPPATSSSGLVLPADSQYLSAADTNDLEGNSNAAQAELIMSLAGFHTSPAGYWADSKGQEAKFTIEEPAGTANFASAVLVAQELAAAGFDVGAEAVPPAQWERDMAQGTFDASIRGSVAGPTPYYMYRNWLDPSLLKKGRATNGGDYELLDAATAPTAAAAVKSALAEYRDNPSGSPAASSAVKALASVVSNYLPVIPLLYGVAWGEFSTRHVNGWPDDADPYEPAEPSAPFDEYTVLQLTSSSS